MNFDPGINNMRIMFLFICAISSPCYNAMHQRSLPFSPSLLIGLYGTTSKVQLVSPL